MTVWIVLEAYGDMNDWHVNSVYDSIVKASDARDKLLAEGVDSCFIDIEEHNVE